MTGKAKDLIWPDDETDLVPFLPFIFSVWVDGTLAPAEMSAVGRTIDALEWLEVDSRRVLGAWLDPSAPPSPSALHALRTRIRGRVPLQAADAQRSLTGLGLALWRQAGVAGPWSDPAAETALRGLESSLGLLGAEAARGALGLLPPPAAAQPAPVTPEGGALRAYLDRDHRQVRDRTLGILLAPTLRIPLGLAPAEYRERVLEAVRHLAREGLGSLGYPTRYGGQGDPAAAVAVFETLAFGDLSVVVKFGVQFGLFGGSVLQLGTERHHEAHLRAIASLGLPGCYAMTETGHGSNVRDLETTATYDAATDELVIHTPHAQAAKNYIGNAAAHGLMATVFARVIVSGEDHGVHAVLVPLRDQRRRLLPGVAIEDCGAKEGLDGVDNGRIVFDRVRVPRTNLLDRFATIDDQGRYRSDIPSAGRRFFRMLRTLVMGRVSIAAASVSAAKVGLTIAVRYASERRQFGPEGGPEQPILDYPLVQRALMPALATTFGLHFAVRRLQTQVADAATGDSAELEVAAAGLKAYASEHCVAALQASREICGGAGYMARARFAALKADTDVFTTFEGANLVLYQLVAKGLLSRFRDEMGDLSLRGAVRYLAERAETALTELNPVVTRRTDDEHLMDPEMHAGALAYREERLLRSAAMRMRARLEDGMDSFRAVVECQDHLVALARAHVERVVLDGLGDAVTRAPGPGLSEILSSVSALFALAAIERDRGWFLEAGYLEPAKSRAIRARVGALCREVRDHAGTLTDAFAIPNELLPEIGRGAGTRSAGSPGGSPG
ncbi:MAG: acyl-CoA dehydrogenase [Gemmatimonadales bacterium]